MEHPLRNSDGTRRHRQRTSPDNKHNNNQKFAAARDASCSSLSVRETRQNSRLKRSVSTSENKTADKYCCPSLSPRSSSSSEHMRQQDSEEAKSNHNQEDDGDVTMGDGGASSRHQTRQHAQHKCYGHNDQNINMDENTTRMNTHNNSNNNNNNNNNNHSRATPPSRTLRRTLECVSAQDSYCSPMDVLNNNKKSKKIKTIDCRRPPHNSSVTLSSPLSRNCSHGFEPPENSSNNNNNNDGLVPSISSTSASSGGQIMQAGHPQCAKLNATCTGAGAVLLDAGLFKTAHHHQHQQHNQLQNQFCQPHQRTQLPLTRRRTVSRLLPGEVIAHCTSFASARDVVLMASVCTHWRQSLLTGSVRLHVGSLAGSCNACEQRTSLLAFRRLCTRFPNANTVCVQSCRVAYDKRVVRTIISKLSLSLTNLDLSACMFVTEASFASLLTHCPKLQRLALKGCRNIHGATCVKTPPLALKALRTLHRLDLTGTSFTALAVFALHRAVSVHRSTRGGTLVGMADCQANMHKNNDENEEDLCPPFGSTKSYSHHRKHHQHQHVDEDDVCPNLHVALVRTPSQRRFLGDYFPDLVRSIKDLVTSAQPLPNENNNNAEAVGGPAGDNPNPAGEGAGHAFDATVDGDPNTPFSPEHVLPHLSRMRQEFAKRVRTLQDQQHATYLRDLHYSGGRSGYGATGSRKSGVFMSTSHNSAISAMRQKDPTALDVMLQVVLSDHDAMMLDAPLNAFHATALMFASLTGRTSAVEALVILGADIEAATNAPPASLPFLSFPSNELWTMKHKHLDHPKFRQPDEPTELVPANEGGGLAPMLMPPPPVAHPLAGGPFGAAVVVAQLPQVDVNGAAQEPAMALPVVAVPAVVPNNDVDDDMVLMDDDEEEEEDEDEQDADDDTDGEEEGDDDDADLFNPNADEVAYMHVNAGRMVASDREDGGASALYAASHRGHRGTVELLLKHGANVNAVRDSGVSSLYVAAQEGHLDVLQLLLRSNANVECRRVDGTTPLFIASQEGHLDVVAVLLQHGADPNLANHEGVTALCSASRWGHLEVVKLLLEYDADSATCDTSGATPLYCAAQEGHVPIVDALLEHGASVDEMGKDGATPLFVASSRGHQGIVKMLLKAGADASHRMVDGTTPVFIAAQMGHCSIISLLWSGGATCAEATTGASEVVDINACRTDKVTPLLIATAAGHVRCTTLLLRLGANPDVITADGTSPLYLAAQEGNEELVGALIESGASLQLQDESRATPLHIAAHSGHLEVVRLLMANGADVTATTVGGFIPLHYAIQSGHKEVARLLLSDQPTWEVQIAKLRSAGGPAVPGELVFQ